MQQETDKQTIKKFCDKCGYCYNANIKRVAESRCPKCCQRNKLTKEQRKDLG